jgi:hypothetical protein
MCGYVLALKGNQKLLYEKVSLCFGDPRFLGGCGFYEMLERAWGGVEKCECWYLGDVVSLSGRKDWVGLKLVVMAWNAVAGYGQPLCRRATLLVVCLWVWLKLLV